MLWDRHEGWVVLDVVQLPEEDFSLVGKMFPLRAGRSHFSLSNFQMQDAGDEMSAYVRLSVCFSMCISLLDQCLCPLCCNIRFSNSGRKKYASLKMDVSITVVLQVLFTTRKRLAGRIVFSAPNIFECAKCKSNWKKRYKTHVAWLFLASQRQRSLAVSHASAAA